MHLAQAQPLVRESSDEGLNALPLHLLQEVTGLTLVAKYSSKCRATRRSTPLCHKECRAYYKTSDCFLNRLKAIRRRLLSLPAISAVCAAVQLERPCQTVPQRTSVGRYSLLTGSRKSGPGSCLPAVCSYRVSNSLEIGAMRGSTRFL